MTSREMLKTVCPPGYWFENVAPLGSRPNWQLRQCPPKDKDGRPQGFVPFDDRRPS